ncbi:hypothetical protein K435DRAFT_790690 [Dendrothele bispora CBS 962.96]|uniref:Uncharacterized protein n=1 Tax=Dendrothele bispora (strain CBS 962.96) TaxID=1314807 RepID=A0A4S8MNX9_DENBC|nr:hypothetical protein K435DRAFT_790690 [Dendrothele bispora CBS 962.96]
MVKAPKVKASMVKASMVQASWTATRFIKWIRSPPNLQLKPPPFCLHQFFPLVSMLRTEQFPPFHPGQLTDEEKSLLRRSTKEIFIQEIRCYEHRHRDIGHGYNHNFGPLQIDFGKVHWSNVGRVYRICYNSDHRDRNSPCALQWLSEPLPPRLRKQLDSYRAIFDMTGAPWCPYTFPVPESIRNQAMWDQLECRRIPALQSIFERLRPDSEYTNDESDHEGSDYEPEPDEVIDLTD